MDYISRYQDRDVSLGIIRSPSPNYIQPTHLLNPQLKMLQSITPGMRSSKNINRPLRSPSQATTAAIPPSAASPSTSPSSLPSSPPSKRLWGMGPLCYSSITRKMNTNRYCTRAMLTPTSTMRVAITRVKVILCLLDISKSYISVTSSIRRS